MGLLPPHLSVERNAGLSACCYDEEVVLEFVFGHDQLCHAPFSRYSWCICFQFCNFNGLNI